MWSDLWKVTADAENSLQQLVNQFPDDLFHHNDTDLMEPPKYLTSIIKYYKNVIWYNVIRPLKSHSWCWKLSPTIGQSISWWLVRSQWQRLNGTTKVSYLKYYQNVTDIVWSDLWKVTDDAEKSFRHLVNQFLEYFMLYYVRDLYDQNVLIT
jgi:hypothetical protein